MNKKGEGVAFHSNICYAEVYNFLLGVVFEKDAIMPELWSLYINGMKNYAEGNSAIVVLTKSDGSIGQVQHQEVDYIANCDGKQVSGGLQRADLRGARKLALTCDEFEAWCRISNPEPPRLDKLGADLLDVGLDSGAACCLPSAELAESRFRQLALGDGGNPPRSAELRTRVLMDRLAAGYDHSLALTSGGQLVQWGDASSAQREGLPKAPPPGQRWVALAAGSRHSLALTSGGQLVQWGGASSAQRKGLPEAPPPGQR